jgi:hypothetical protein
VGVKMISPVGIHRPRRLFPGMQVAGPGRQIAYKSIVLLVSGNQQGVVHFQHTEKIRTMAGVQARHDSLVSVEEALFDGGYLYQAQQSRLHMRVD